MDHKAIFQGLKKEMMDVPIFIRPDFSQHFWLKNDWSLHGMGDMVLQVDGKK